MTYISNIVSKLNRLRLGNKDKWVMGSITLVDLPNYETCVATLKYKMYNTWVQVLQVEITNSDKREFIKYESPMGMKPIAFKAWLECNLKSAFRVMFNG